MTVGVLDYEVGNVGSILSMLRKLSIPAERVQRPDQLEACSAFILPGVGAFDDVVTRFRSSGLEAPLRNLVLDGGQPLLGICVGLQMLAEGSEEGTEPGLGWVPGRVRHLRHLATPSLRLPVMGWYYVAPANGSQIAMAEDSAPQRYYFTHSYYFACDDRGDEAAHVDYGAPVTVALQRGSIWATQFHPEKSHHFGMGLIRRFVSSAAPSAAG